MEVKERFRSSLEEMGGKAALAWCGPGVKYDQWQESAERGSHDAMATKTKDQTQSKAKSLPSPSPPAYSAGSLPPISTLAIKHPEKEEDYKI
ncbi:hypothetical protein NQZ68_010209 [Dissostichus eleginoides]|nr:hypothetical protein NQZ68_010209 [Dissostichus eleginoides]